MRFSELITKPAADLNLWHLDPSIDFLNHGSFGSCPRAVLEFQQAMRVRMERKPIHFMVCELEGLLDAARRELARFVGAEPDRLVFVTNATTGVNTVLKSLDFSAKDELLVTNHEYNACRNALNVVAEKTGARVIVAEIPFPVKSGQEVVDAILSKVTAATRIVLVDHVTSQTGLVFPLKEVVQALNERKVESLVDGAHAPGMVPLELDSLGATYYTGNCHKWLCAPKGAGFLYVQPERQKLVRPLTISHGANSPRTDRSRFQIEFSWPGTWDPSAFLSVPTAIEFMGQRLPGGWPSLMERNRQLALAARDILCDALKVPKPSPDEMVGALVSVPLPGLSDSVEFLNPLYQSELQQKLARLGIEVPVIPWPPPRREIREQKRVIRISAQSYNYLGQYERLAEVLQREFQVGAS